MHFIYFLGRFHVLAVHLPITLILVVAALEWMARSGRRPDLEPVMGLAWSATAITAVGTAILGYMHFAEGGFTGSVAQAHRALGTSIAMVSLAGWIMRSRVPGVFDKARPTIVVLLVGLVVVTGHLGGSLTHGKDYLVQYAPNFIRELAGLPPSGPQVTTIAAADPYVDVVDPLLEANCVNCHNASKQKGGLDMTSYSSLMRGGTHGPVIVKGDAAASDLIRRISLPQTSDDFMPNGKAPLPADQIAILRWWVDSGAKTGIKVLALRPPQQIQTLIQSQLNPGAASSPEGELAKRSGAINRSVEQAAQKLAHQDAEEEAEAPNQADPKLVRALVDDGFMARQISLGNPQLIVSPVAPGTQFATEQIQALATASNNQVVNLDLSNAGLGDSAMVAIAHLTSLTQLRLEGNKLTDQSVHALSVLPKLTVLNLYGNRGITDAIVDTLAGMRSLRHVYLWQTSVSTAGVAKLRHLRPDIEVDAGDGGAPGLPSDNRASSPQSGGS